MKKFLIPLLAALSLAACNECDKAAQLQTDLKSIAKTVSEAVSQRQFQGYACDQYASAWKKILANGADFATDASVAMFSYETSSCAPGEIPHWERRCEGPSRMGDQECHDVALCTHHKPGYAESVRLASELTVMRTELGAACRNFGAGRFEEANAFLTSVANRLDHAQADVLVVLRDGGCLKQ